MTLKLGTAGLIGIYQGSTPIVKICQGSNLVFQKSKGIQFIEPMYVPDDVETGLVISHAKLIGDNKPYEVTMDASGDLLVLGSGGTSDMNGLQDPTTVDENKKIFYIPSSFHTVGARALYGLKNIFPNLTDIVIGEGVVSLANTSLAWNTLTTGNPLTDVLPKLVLPKSLKKINTISKFHIKEFDAKLYDYTYYGAKAYVKSAFNGCHIENVYANNSLLEVNLTSNDTSLISGMVGDGLYNGFEKCYIQNISRIGSYQFKYIYFNHLDFGNTVTELAEYAFNSCVFKCKQLNIPKNLKIFGGSSLVLQADMNVVFEHSNNDEITFNLNSSNQGPFYKKNAYTLNVYTDNDYIRNWDWLTNENATVTFYHLDGTLWE